MVVSIFFPPLMPVTASGYVIEGSGLFDGSSGYLSRTPASVGNLKTWTFSCVLKIADILAEGSIFGVYTDSNNFEDIALTSTGQLLYQYKTGGSNDSVKQTTSLNRDPSAYLHIVAQKDAVNATFKFFVNGVLLTDYATDNEPSNINGLINTAVVHTIGDGGGIRSELGAYVANAVLVDGLALTPSSFGETTDDGFWQINDVSGLFEATQTYFPTSARFDGTNDGLKLEANLTDAVDSEFVFYSFWVKLNGGNGTNQYIQGQAESGGGDIYVALHTSGQWRFYAHNDAVNAAGYILESNTVHTTASGWTHVMMSVNGTEEHLYINGVEDLKAGFTHIDATYVGVNTEIGVGQLPYGGGTNRLNGDLADFIYAQQYIDLSDAANRAKFITTDGDPVAWATSLAAISAPKIAMHLDADEAVANFADNADGTGQAFTIVGTLTDGDDVTVLKNSFLLEGGTNVAAGTNSSYTEPTSYVPVPVTFDGTNDILTRGADLTGASDTPSFFISCWVKRIGGIGSAQVIFADDVGYLNATFNTANKFHVVLYQEAGDTQITNILSSNTIVADNNWHHLMASVNGSTQHMYIDNVSVLTSSVNTSGDIFWEKPIAVGAYTGGSAKLNADIADLIVDDTYIDLSNSTNREKFISATGEPVNPGSDGATAMGASPLIYLNSNALATWHTNSGTGGGFTEGGALTAGSTVRGTSANDFSKTGTITQTSDSGTNDSANDYGNYALIRDAGKYVATISEQSLRSTGATASQSSAAISTIPFDVEDTEGFYVESQWLVGNVDGANFNSIGIVQSNGTIGATSGSIRTASSVSYQEDGTVHKFNPGSAAQTYTTWGGNTGHRPVLFVKAGKIWFGLDKNAGSVTWNGDPSNGTGEAASGLTGMYNFVAYHYATSASMRFNFGATAFLYDPPTGGKSIHTGKLPTPAIINPADHFHSVVVDHDGSSTAFTLPWNADTYDTLFIVKNTTDAAEDWYWTNGLRGYNKYQTCPTLVTETTSTTILTISGTSVTLGSTLGNKSYLVECHKAGLAAGRSSDDTGAITVTRSTNTTSQFSIIQRTGTGANTNYGHGLDAVDFRVSLNLSSAHSFSCQHTSLTDGTMILYLDSTGAQNAHATGWNSTFPSSTLCYLGTGNGTNQSSSTYNEYLWGSVDGYSAFGKYEGNGNADGAFINTGLYGNKNFVKNIDSAYSWQTVSTTEQNYNTGANPSLQFDSTGVGGTAAYDVVSNGLKMRTANANYNSAETFIYGSWGGIPIQGDGAVNQGRAK